MSQKSFTVGIDIDNTLIDYTGVFYQVGRDLGWLPELNDTSKAATKGFLHDAKEFERWTELQGIVYGRMLHKAALYSGALECVRGLLAAGVRVEIISHKTRYPYLGPKVDLHQAALSFLNDQQLIGDEPNQVPFSQVHFLEEKQTKVARIAEAKCDVFIDDLLEIFALDGFPSRTQALWFAPELFDAKTGRITHQSTHIVSQLTDLASRGIQMQLKANWEEIQRWLQVYAENIGTESEGSAKEKPAELRQ